ncbi:protein IMPACT homolog [Saccostrea echinata]|uniref:protein IMPACT homolog n=1 Tax=Saccostrea echinata TaxID=191078 RepID=UPI002A82E687|nr:protein IMPACT homolog [Saccostrea echinata]
MDKVRTHNHPILLKKSENVNLPFFITAQEPASVLEERKRLYAISDSMRKQNIKTKIEKGGVVMPDGKRYQDPIPKLEAADALQLPVDEIQTLDDFKVECTEPTKIRGSEIFATGQRVCSVTEVEKLYKKVCIDAYSAAADHRILVYRFMETSGKLCEGYWDDGEHGAGRRLLQYMQTNEILNAGAVITRWSGPIRLGQVRFKIMEDHLCDLANLLHG